MSFSNAIYVNGVNAPIEAADTTKKHPLGTRMVLEDGRVFVYAKANAAIPSTSEGVKNATPQGVSYRSVGAAAAATALSVTLTTVSPDGITGDGSIIADEFEGGYALFFATGGKFIRRITGNTAVAAAGAITITLDRPIGVALTTSSGIELMHSPYYAVQTSNNINHPVVGVPACTATSGQYLWIQTWGVCWCSPQASVGVTASGDVGLCWRHDGSLEAALETPSGSISSQYAGYVIAGLDAGTQAAPFFMLQLAP